MKLVLAIVNNDDSVIVSSALTKNGFSVTKYASTGGFLMVGNTTLMVGTEDARVDEVKEIVRRYCATRKKMTPSPEFFGQALPGHGIGNEVIVGGATFFVLDVSDFGKL